MGEGGGVNAADRGRVREHGTWRACASSPTEERARNIRPLSALPYSSILFSFSSGLWLRFLASSFSTIRPLFSPLHFSRASSLLSSRSRFPSAAGKSPHTHSIPPLPSAVAGYIGPGQAQAALKHVNYTFPPFLQFIREVPSTPSHRGRDGGIQTLMCLRHKGGKPAWPGRYE